MRVGIVMLWAFPVALGGCLVIFTGARYWQARSLATEAQLTLTVVSRQAADLASLRSSAPRWMLRDRPATGLTPRISAALTGAGLLASAMSSVSPEAESPVGDADLKAKRARAVLTLTGVTLPQLGAFLKAWRSLEPDWVVSSLDLAPQEGQPRAQSVGGDLPLRVVVGLELLFVDRPSPEAQGHGFVYQPGGAN